MLFIFCSIYTVIVNFVFEIEKRIWIHSYFDEKDLTTSERWDIAREMFFSAFKFRFVMFLKYYFVPFGLFIGALIFLVQYLNKSFNNEMDVAWIIFFSLIGLIIFLPFYYFYKKYFKFKLRYSWFLFFDNYEKEKGINLFNEMHKMNEINKTELFKEQMLLNTGEDSEKSLNQSILEILDLNASQPSVIRGLNNDINQIYKNETNNQLIDLGDIITQHILFNLINRVFLDKENITNENIYKLLM
jgi:hypothetical protein